MSDETDLASLGIKVDASQVTPAATQLDKLTASGKATEAQTLSLAAATKALSDAQAAGIPITSAQIQAVGGYANAQKILSTAIQQTSATQTAAAAIATRSNATIGESLGALGTTAVRTAATMTASYEAEAAASVESAAVQVAAHGAIRGSSVKIREAIVILREAMRGDFSRMAGSASILLTAFGLLETVLLPLLAVSAVAFTAVAIGTHEINRESGDLTKNLDLNATQLARVKDRYVELGDTAKAVFEVLGKDIIAALGPGTISELTSGWETFVGFLAMGFEGLIGEANVLKQLALDIVGKGGGISLAQAFMNGASAAHQFLDDVASQARLNAIERILKQAGNPGSDHLRHDLTEKTKLSNDDQREQNAILEKEIELAGLSNDQREVAIAQYKILLDLRKRGGTRLVNSAYGQQAIDLGGDHARDVIGARRASLLNDVGDSGTALGTKAAKDTLANNPDAYVKKQKAAYDEINALVRQRVLTETQGLQAIARVDADIMKQRLSAADDFFGNLATLSDSKNKELAAIGKAAAIAQATIDGILAVQKALAAYPPPLNYIEAGAVGIAAAANVAKIAGFDKGGWTGNGAPNQVAGAVHGQEFVVKAGPAAANRSALEAMNRGGNVSSGPSVVVNNYGTPQRYDVESWSENEIRLIARDEDKTNIPNAMAAEAKNKSSKFRRAMQQHTDIKSKLSA